MSATVLQPDTLRNALEMTVATEIECSREGDHLLLDTPYPAGRGYFLRAYITASDRGIIVSDGGFATTQIEMYVRSRATLRHRYDDLNAIAQKLGIVWDGDFSYVDDTLEDAVRRLTVLAQAVQEGQQLATSRGARLTNATTERLLDELEKRGVNIQENARILVPGQKKSILVDLELKREDRRAAVNVFSARSKSNATKQLEHFATDFNVLSKGGYKGTLFAVYREDSPLRDDAYRDRFIAATPEIARLVSDEEASEEIARDLAA